MATVGHAAMPLGYDSGLPDFDDDLPQFLEDIAMTADDTFPWQSLAYSELASPLGYLSPRAASDWSRSPGRQSHQNSNTGASSSLSPGTASLILTPTSTLLEYGGDVTLLEDPEASDIIPSSPGSGASPSSDGYVHVDHPAGQSHGRGNMSTRPPPASCSGATSLSSHQPGVHSGVFASTSTLQRQWPSSNTASTSSTGGWMDEPNPGHWGHLDSFALGFTNANLSASELLDTDPLSDIGAIDDETPRTFDGNLPFRPVDEHGNTLAHDPYASYYPYALQHPQQHQPQATPTTADAHYYPLQQHATHQPMQINTAQPASQRLIVPPTVPSQHDQTYVQGSASIARSMQQRRSADSSVSPSSNPSSFIRNARYPPYSAVSQQQVVQHPHTQHTNRLGMSSHAQTAATRSSRQLQPALSGPSRAAHSQSAQIDRRRGGRQRNTHLAHGTREKSSKMRKTGACWRCALQRDACPDEGTPCNRCLISSQKGQRHFFDCDRSKLPDFVHDFLPPSMTGMHQKQSIEDCVDQRVIRFDKNNSIDVYLTSGYGPALKWRLYEFVPKGDELLGQLQYLQDPTTGTSVSSTKYSPPFGLLKLDTSDDTHFDAYMNRLLHPDHLWEFGWTCFEEETQVDDFQAQLLQLMCNFSMQTPDYDLRELLQKIIRMMIITYIMGHTLTISEDTLDAVLSSVQHSRRPNPIPTKHISPRLANRQLKFFFCILRNQIYDNILNWQQQTLHSGVKKEATWLPAFCVMLGFAMVLEEVQRTIFMQADAKAQKQEMPFAQADLEAFNACDRIDTRFRLLVGLFQCKYRDRKWSKPGSFGNQTPELRDPASKDFLAQVAALLLEKREHLESRKDVPLGSANQCLYTSRLVARFLLPFLNLPA